MCMKNLDLYIFESHVVKSKVKISQNFVAFSEYMNFKHEQFVRNRIKKVDFIFNQLQ